MEEQIILELQDQLRAEKEKFAKLIEEKNCIICGYVSEITNLKNVNFNLIEQCNFKIGEKDSIINGLEEDKANLREKISHLEKEIKNLDHSLVKMEASRINIFSELNLKLNEIEYENNDLKNKLHKLENESAWTTFKRALKKLI